MKHNWEYKQLGDICSILMGQSPSSDSYNDESKGLPFFQGCSDFGKIYPSVTKFCSKPIRVAAEKDILFSVRAPIGTMNIANVPCCIGRGLCSFRIHAPNLQKYLFYALNVTKPKIIEKGTGSTFKAVNKDVLFRHIIPVPPLNVQEQIVAELDKINETIEDCRELLRNLDALAQSLFYDFFGDPNINPKGWEMRKFAEVCDTFTDGDWIESKDQSTDGFRLIQTGNIGEGIYLDKSERSKFISADTFYSLKCKEVFEGDILISRLPDPIGRACILPKLPLRSITAVDCTIVRPKSFILPNFLLQYTLTDAYYNSLSSITKGATRKRVSRGNLGKVLIPVPPISLQEQFAARIEQIEVQKKAVEQTIAELQTLLDSRMDYYFG